MFKCLTIIITLIIIFELALSDSDKLNVCLCNRNYNPVCASNGKTYSNKCVFNCYKNEHPEEEEDLRIVAPVSCEHLHRAEEL